MEIRNTKPYISHLIVTQRVTTMQVPQDKPDAQGNQLVRVFNQAPGIYVEITPYITPTIKAPAKPYEFPLKAYWQKGVDQLTAKENKTPEELGKLNRLITYVNNPNMIWAEDILESENLGPFDSLWSEVFSQGLDVFPEWLEPQVSSPGVPVAILPLQWNAFVPFESAKNITVKLGVYSVDKDGKVIESVPPTQHAISFEDNATKASRENLIKQLEDRITELTKIISDLTTEIATLPEGSAKETKIQTKTQVEAEKAGRVNELAQRKAVTNELISKLIALPAVQTSLPLLSLSVLMNLSSKENWGLDRTTTLTELSQTLGLLAQA